MKNRWMELGRSMVEMLGVLAIIGVLSIVGIAGYRKAMAKQQGNTLFEMGLKTYRAAYEKVFVNPKCSGNACKMYWRSSTISGSQSASMNIGGDKPSWIPLERFNILATNMTSTSYHQLLFYSVGDCKICKGLEPLTEKVNDTANYRLVPGSKRTGILTNGIRVYCYQGSEEDGTLTDGKDSSCFP